MPNMKFKSWLVSSPRALLTDFFATVWALINDAKTLDRSSKILALVQGEEKNGCSKVPNNYIDKNKCTEKWKKRLSLCNGKGQFFMKCLLGVWKFFKLHYWQSLKKLTSDWYPNKNQSMLLLPSNRCCVLFLQTIFQFFSKIAALQSNKSGRIW